MGQRLAIVLTAGCLLLSGCGSASTSSPQTCTREGFLMLVTPKDPSVTPDHNLSPPGNMSQFLADQGSTYGPGCDTNHLYQPKDAQWTSSNPAAVTIDSTPGTTNGVATCLTATTSDTIVTATLTAYGFTESRTAPIVCK